MDFAKLAQGVELHCSNSNSEENQGKARGAQKNNYKHKILMKLQNLQVKTIH